MITIVNSPHRYTPSNNPIIFQIASNNPNIIKFDVQLIEAVSNSIINKFEYYVRPDSPTSVSCDLSNVLSNLVEVGLNNSINTLVATIDSAVFAYRLKIKERIIVAGVVVDGASYDVPDDRFYVWDASFDRLLFNQYNPDNYIINTNNHAKFLSVKPQFVNTTGTASEYLYFINDSYLAKTVRIRVYDPTGVQINNYSGNIPDGKMIRLNVSPKALNNLFGTDFSLVGHYRIDLLNSSNNPISETKVYKYVGDPCYLQPVNFIFSTSLGNYESFTFFNPKETITTTKTSLKSNPLQLNNGLYSDNVNGVLNQIDKTINVSATSSFTVFSNVLSDDEFVYLKELFTSKNVYVELSDNNTVVPVTIKNNNYNILLRHNNGYKLNRLEVTYETQSGFIPSKSDLFGSGTGSAQIQFLDLPLPTVTNNGIIYVDSSNGNITI